MSPHSSTYTVKDDQVSREKERKHVLHRKMKPKSTREHYVISRITYLSLIKPALMTNSDSFQGPETRLTRFLRVKMTKAFVLLVALKYPDRT